MKKLQTSILPEHWDAITSLEFNLRWRWARLLTPSVCCCSTHSTNPSRLEEEWKRHCHIIKSLKALQQLTLVLYVDLASGMMRQIMWDVLSSLEGLKDLRLKDPWELRVHGSEEQIKFVDATLKEVGFDCFVTCSKV